MELFETLNLFCHRNSGAVPKPDMKRHSFMLKRLFSAQYPMQCNFINSLDTDPELASDVVALLASRYTDIPQFLKIKVNQKKRKDSIFKDYEDEVLNKYMEINGIGFRELNEAYEFSREEVEKSLDLIKRNFFGGKDKVIIKKVPKKKKEDEPKLF